MEKNFGEELIHTCKSRYPLIVVKTNEEERAFKEVLGISNVDDFKRMVYMWSCTTNLCLCDFETGNIVQETSTTNIQSLMRFVESFGSKKEHATKGTSDFGELKNGYKGVLFVVKDLFDLIGGRGGSELIANKRLLLDIMSSIRKDRITKNIVCITNNTDNIPKEMEDSIYILDFSLPTQTEILDKYLTILDKNKIDIDENLIYLFSKSAQGLTMTEAELVFCKMIIKSKKNLKEEHIEEIFEEKKAIVKRSGILDFIKSDVHISDVGGLENLKSWIKKRTNSWGEEAKEYNIPQPKGILVIGVPGCGKSLISKAVCSMWNIPLLRLDIGKIFHGIVGSSEENMRQAINTAESVSPCILWIDEIEKGFSGTSSSGDSGTTARIFGTFLTWMQEKVKPVFVIATANNVATLPPEFLRKGRFDEIFFVDLPQKEEREIIFNIHLNKMLKNSKASEGGLNISKGDLDKLVESTSGYSGAEIEQVVVNSVFEAFSERRILKIEDIKSSIDEIVPLSVTMKEGVERLREWAKDRAVPASMNKNKFVIEEESPGVTTKKATKRKISNINKNESILEV